MILLGEDGENTLGVTARKSGRTKNWSEILDSGVFPGTQGGPLMHVIASKAVSFGEALQDDFTEYQKKVQANAQTLAEEFKKMGYNLVSDGTDNHLILIDLRNKELTGKIAEEALERANITLNKNMVPFDPESPFVTSGIRIGSPAMTTRGMGKEEFKHIAKLIDRVLQDPENEEVVEACKKEVTELCDQFPLYDFVTA
jgi:glycine hydroxymethyltransferase